MTVAENNVNVGNVVADVVDERPVVLKVDHVAKSFRLPTEQASGLKMAFLNWTKGIKGYTEQKVLRDISFEVRQGDFFGIVGRNGSGKSTLLKIISQIYVPEQGTVDVRGKLVPFIELGVGFNPELTGRENVYLNGALLGFTRDEITAMYDDIVEFAELGEFMDQKLKNYSSGMQVRLAFSVAIKAQGDILVLDEVLAVGDEAFQRKCDNFFSQMKKDPTKTIILVTHSMDAVKKYCNRAILIKDGEIIVSGNKDDVADRYTLENLETKQEKKEKSNTQDPALGLTAAVPSLRVEAVSSRLCNDISKNFCFDIAYEYREQKEHYLAISLMDVKRGGVTYDMKLRRSSREGLQHVHFSMPLHLFSNGDYKIVAAVRVDDEDNPNATKMLAFTSDANSCSFSIRQQGNSEYSLLNQDSLAIEVS